MHAYAYACVCTRSVCAARGSRTHLRSNHESNWSADEKTSGRRKLRSAQSSCRLFCMGVPVMSSRECESRERSTCESFDSSFFMRCASSTIT